MRLVSWNVLNRVGEWRWERGPAPHATGLLVVLLTGLAWVTPPGAFLARWSYDLLFAFQSPHPPPGIVMVVIDEPSCTQLQQPYPQWDRALHAQLLGRLSEAPARLVVFDIYFPESDPRAGDERLAAAIGANGRVLLAADCSPIPGHRGTTVSPPLAPLRHAARGWGLSIVDPGEVVRTHHPGTGTIPSLPWASAAALAAPVTRDAAGRLAVARWIRYYGGPGTLPSVS